MLRGRQILPKDRGKDRIEDDLPCGIALQANGSILVESVFHGARPVEYRNEFNTNAPAVKMFHGAKGAKFGEIEKYFSLPSLRSWRLGVKIFVDAFC